MPDFDPNTATPVGGGDSARAFDPDTATPVGGNASSKPLSVDDQLRADREASFPINPEIGGPHQTFVKQHLADLAQHVYNFFDKHNQQGVGEGLSSAIYGLAPDSKTGQAMMVLASALPALGQAAGAGSEAVAEASPLLSKTLGYVATLGESGLVGATSRVGAAALGGAATGAATGEGAMYGAEQGAVQDIGGEIPQLVSSAGQYAYDAAVDKSGLIAAGQDAAAKTGERNLAERAKNFEAAQTAISKGNEAVTTLGEADQLGAAKVDKLAQQTAPAIRERIIQQATGRSPEQTNLAVNSPPEISEGVAVPGPEYVARRQKYLDASFGSTQRQQDELGRQYESALGPFLNNPVQDVSPIGSAVDSEEKYAAENNVIHSPAIKKLLADAKGVAPQTTSPLASMIPAKDLAAMSPQDIARAEAQMAANKNIVYADADGATRAIRPQEFAAAREAAKAQAIANQPKVAQLRGIRGQAAQLMAKSTSATDKATANAIREGVEQSLESAGVPGVKDLNAKYAAFKNLFGSDFYRGIAKAKDPIDAAPLLFNEPQRTALLTANASPEQMQTLREIYGDAVNSGFKVDPKTQGAFLQRAFPNTPLADPKSWIHLPDKLVKAQNMLLDDPDFQQQVDGMMTTERRKAATGIVQDLMGEVKKLGPAGQPIMNQVAQAKSPEEAATILTQALTGMKPEDAVKAMAAHQVTPDDSAIMSIQQGARKGEGQGGAYILNRAKKMFPVYGTFVALSSLMGKSPSMWIGGMAGLGAIGAGSELLKRSFTNTLADPIAASAFWHAAQNPVEQASKNVLAQGIVRLAASAGMNAFTNDAPNPTDQPAPTVAPAVTPSPPPPDKVPLPAVRTAYLGAEKDHDDAKMKEIRNMVIKRVKDGEWDKLPPDQKQQLAPWMRTMFGPKSAEAAG